MTAENCRRLRALTHAPHYLFFGDIEGKLDVLRV
jgi:hypothetical protein